MTDAPNARCNDVCCDRVSDVRCDRVRCGGVTVSRMSAANERLGFWSLVTAQPAVDDQLL